MCMCMRVCVCVCVCVCFLARLVHLLGPDTQACHASLHVHRTNLLTRFTHHLVFLSQTGGFLNKGLNGAELNAFAPP